MARVPVKLDQAVRAWDGKSAAAIEAVYDGHHGDKGFAAGLIELLSIRDAERGATWLLKHHLDGGNRLTAPQVRKVHRALADLAHWESRLHLLQCQQYLSVAAADRAAVEHFVRRCLGDDNKFVRAWAYDALYRLAVQYTDLSEELDQIFEMAMRDEAPSVKARIRRLLAAR